MQVREYFVKTGVFHVLSTNRFSADGTTTTSGAFENSPTDAQLAAQQPNRSMAELLGTPALQNFSVSGAGPSKATPNQGTSYSVPMHHGAFTDPTDQQPRSMPFSLAGQGMQPTTCHSAAHSQVIE
jgi:hypothetical protein